MRALIDGDIILHSCTQGRDDEEEYYTLGAAKRMIQNILDEVGATEYEVLLSGDWTTNFRYEVYPEYKANRRAERPAHFTAVHRYLLEHWGGRVVEGEADDTLGFLGYQAYSQSVRDATYEGRFVQDISKVVICTIDKDLNMIPGWHYNWKRDTHLWLDDSEAWLNFFSQLLTGDSVDGIPGLKGVGPKTAEKILDMFVGKKEMAEIVAAEYKTRKYHENYMYTMADLLWITRERGVRGSTVLRSLLND